MSRIGKRVAGAVALAMLVAMPAFGEDAPAKVVKQPDDAVFEKAWPPAAKAQGIGGRAALRCKVSASGELSGCTTIDEYPSAQGFAAALLSIAQQFKVAPARRDGRAVDSDIVLEGDWFAPDKDPDWLRKPTPQDLLAVYPREALQMDMSGSAVIDCIVGLQGALFDCIVMSENPPGRHFGEAALALTPQLLMRPGMKKGKIVLSDVRIPMEFRLSGAGGSISADPVVSPAMVWPAAPTYADVIAAYPAKAKAAGSGGRATLYCGFHADGRIENCSRVSEEPFGAGFAAAARKLTEKFRAYPITSGGKSLAEATVQIPFTFDPSVLHGTASVGRPLWAGLPSTDDLRAAFAATPTNVGAVRVVLDCSVQQGGWVKPCKIESETPEGKGFGQAALALSAKFRVNTWTAEGLPVVGGQVRIPIRFETGEPTAPAAAPNP